METWENVTDGVVYVPTTDSRGRERAVKILAHARAQISTDDRENLEAIKPGRNPFQNGRLRRVDANATPEQRSAAVTDDELLALVELDETDFVEWLNEDSELNVRRLRTLMRANRLGSLVQHQVIDETILRRWPNLDYTKEQRALHADWAKYDEDSL